MSMKSLKVNAVLNTAKTICSIIFPLITIPYASRILHSGNYGKVSWSNSVIQYFILFASLGIATYAQREGPRFRDQKEKFRIFSSELFTINVFTTIIAYVVLFISLIVFTKMRNYKNIILIQSLMIILSTLGLDWVNTVYEDYFYITVRYIIIQIICLIALFVFVRSSNDYLIYAFIMVIANAGGNLFNIFYVRKYTRVTIVPLKQCKQHMAPVFKLFAVSLATVIYISSDITILGIYKGDKDVGVYSIASRVYSTIKTILNALMAVALPRLSFYLGHQEEDNFNTLLRSIFNYLITFILPVNCGLFMLSKPIMFLLGGTEYIRGFMPLRILSLSLFFAVFACYFATGIVLLYKMDNVYLISTFISSISNVVLNFILIPYLGYNGAAITTLIAEFLMVSITAYYSFKQDNIKKNAKYIFGNYKIIISSCLGSLAILITCMIINILVYNQILVILFSVIISVFVYIVFLKLFHNPILDYVINMVRSKIKNSERKI